MGSDAVSLSTPTGWYAVAAVADLPVGGALAAVLADAPLVLWRDETGEVHAHDAHCPHLGAHLGHGGKVVDGSLQCPFHGFRFAPDGRCTATGYGARAPGTLALRRWPVCVRHGVVLVWFGSDGVAPDWEPSEAPDAGWSPARMHLDTLRGHPQEVSENSVDVGHFSWVHGFSDVEELAACTVDGPLLRTHYAFRRPFPAPWGAPVRLRQRIAVEVWGLGFSRVPVTQEESGLELRLLVLPTPLGGGRVALRLALQLRDPASTPGVRPWLRWPATMARAALLGPALATYVAEVRADFAIWEHKAYVSPLRLAAGDGPVGRYRAWARQFYPSEVDARGVA